MEKCGLGHVSNHAALLLVQPFGLRLRDLQYFGVILGLHWDSGKGNGKYYLGFRF